MLRPCWSRMAAATSRGRCWARPSRRCINQLVTSILDVAGAKPLAARHCDLLEGGFSAAAYGHTPKKEKDQLSLAQSRGINPCDRPDPDGPGGLGAEESGTERTGSTQNHLSQMGAAGGWRKWGSNMMHFNDP